MRLAVADDSAVMRAALRHAAATAGHEVVGEATGAVDALELVARERPDVLFVDSRLPPDGALAFVTALLERFPDACVLIVAALAETTLVREAVARGARGAVRRPLDARDVTETLTRFAAPPRA